MDANLIYKLTVKKKGNEKSSEHSIHQWKDGTQTVTNEV